MHDGLFLSHARFSCRRLPRKKGSIKNSQKKSEKNLSSVLVNLYTPFPFPISTHFHRANPTPTTMAEFLHEPINTFGQAVPHQFTPTRSTTTMQEPQQVHPNMLKKERCRQRKIHFDKVLKKVSRAAAATITKTPPFDGPVTMLWIFCFGVIGWTTITTPAAVSRVRPI
jgi:hypothetical protein